jgi:hypothetical protein
MRSIVFRATIGGRQDVPRLVDAAHRFGDVLSRMQVRMKALRQAPTGTRHLQR